MDREDLVTRTQKVMTYSSKYVNEISSDQSEIACHNNDVYQEEFCQ